MKQIINGKIYNTQTAERLGHYSNNRGRGDFGYIDESLYRTKKGRYFLAGEGGAMTKYSVQCGNNCRCEGDGIIAITEAEAREWMEEHCDADDYIEAFGEPEEA